MISPGQSFSILPMTSWHNSTIAPKRGDKSSIHEQGAASTDAVNARSDQVHASPIIGTSIYVGGGKTALNIPVRDNNSSFTENPTPSRNEWLVTLLDTS